MNDSSPAPTPSPPMSTDIDLYCLQCGYNLRGLSGDPRRCPECGYENPMGDLELPEPLVQQELRRMQTVPTVCVAVALVVGLLILGCLTVLARYGFEGDVVMLLLPCAAVAVTPAIIAWIVAVEVVRMSCDNKPGWFRALLHCHLYGLMVAFVGGLPIIILGFLLVPGRRRGIELALKSHPELVVVTLSTAIVVFGCLAVLAFRWMYRQARRDLQPLQRDSAVRIARERLRWRLQYANRRPFIPKRPS